LPIGIMLMRHGFFFGSPLTRTSTGSGFRQPGLMARARAALTRTYGLMPRILIGATKRIIS
jgi:hypothetical protein